MAGQIRRFLRDSNGNVAIVVAFLILPMLVLAGGATDLARAESHRVQLQDGIDRAVLAAASLTQTVTVETTVRDYLKSLDFVDEVELAFDYDLSINARDVKVTASYEMPAGFLPLIGIETLPIRVSAAAVEQRSNIEISLILDMSGSMRYDTPSRLSMLRPAAKEFVDTLLTPQSAPSTTISIVPYAGSVNPGATAFGLLKVPRKHNYSSCVEFVASDYSNAIIPWTSRTQVPHFTHNHTSQNDPVLGWSWCPQDQSAITYLSNNANLLKNRIDSLKMFDGTGTAVGAIWGLQLLDPVMRPFIGQMSAAGVVANEFASRPAAFDDPETLKIIVLMTDGEISQQWRPAKYDYPRNPESPSGNKESESRNTAVNRFYAVCDRAKANGVIVFTIGFRASGSAPTEMRNCASSPSHFYDVQNMDVASAFRSIATAIQKVKLTQ